MTVATVEAAMPACAEEQAPATGKLAVRILLRRVGREIVWPSDGDELPRLRAAVDRGEFGPAAILEIVPR